MLIKNPLAIHKNYAIEADIVFKHATFKCYTHISNISSDVLYQNLWTSVKRRVDREIKAICNF